MRSRAAAGVPALALAVACAGVLASACALALAGEAWATYPGADGRLAFFASGGCGRYSGEGDPCYAQSFAEIMTVSPLGATRPIARCAGPECLGALGPRAVWSPDGTLLAASLRVGRQPVRIAILDASGALVRALAVPVPGAEPLGWLPGGRRVAVLSGTHVLAVPLAGGPARSLGPPYGPRTWSARGDVAILGTAGISVRRAAGGRRRLLLRAGARFRYGRPDWSPDGRRLAVVRTDARTRLQTLITITARGGRSRVVVRGRGEECMLGDPVWAPSGARLALAATCLSQGYDLAPSVYTVRSDGARLRRVFAPSTLAAPSAGLDVFVSDTVSWQARP